MDVLLARPGGKKRLWCQMPVVVQVIDPKIGETVYDPGCGTGGLLA
jgi:hypothetical protein